MTKISIPEGYPKLVSGSWACGEGVTCEKKYVIAGAVVATSDGAEHSVPVSEFRVAPKGATLSETDCHLLDTGSDSDNLIALETCLKSLASCYEDGKVSGVDSAEAKAATEEILEAYGYDKGETVELPSGSELTV